MLHTISSVINGVNPFLQFYKHAANQIEQAGDQGKSIKMVLRADASKDSRRYNLPTVSEVALILPDAPQNFLPRDIILYRRTEDHPQQKSVVKISETHPHFDPLHYVLFLFLWAEEGWVTNIKFSGRRKGQVSPSLFYAYRIMERRVQNAILLGGRLFQQYLVDQYAKVEEQRLNFIRYNQNSIRAEMYDGLADVVLRGDSEGSTVGMKIVLLSIFVGGPRKHDSTVSPRNGNSP